MANISRHNSQLTKESVIHEACSCFQFLLCPCFLCILGKPENVAEAIALCTCHHNCIISACTSAYCGWSPAAEVTHFTSDIGTTNNCTLNLDNDRKTQVYLENYYIFTNYCIQFYYSVALCCYSLLF